MVFHTIEFIENKWKYEDFYGKINQMQKINITKEKRSRIRYNTNKRNNYKNSITQMAFYCKKA